MASYKKALIPLLVLYGSILCNSWQGQAAAPPLVAPIDREALRRLQLRVGEARHLAFPGGVEEVRISRRGIIALQWAARGQARIVALKPGFVLLSSRSSDPDDAKTYGIEVVAPPKAALPQAPIAALPAWLCAPSGLRCESASGFIGGINDDFQHHLRAKAYCWRHQKLCGYEALLSPRAQQQLQVYWQHALGQAWQVQVNPLGVGLVLVSCPADQTKHLSHARQLLDSLSSGMLSRGLLTLSCRNARGVQRFSLDAKVILINSGVAQQAGFDASFRAESLFSSSGLAQPLTQGPRLSLHTRLKSLLAQNKAQIIGEPSLRIIGDSKSLAKSGGEFLNAPEAPLWGPAAATQERWKAYGVALSAIVSPLPGSEDVLLDYDLSLTQPSRGGRHMEASQLRAQLAAPLGQEFIAGSITLSSTSHQTTSQPFLAQLPLLGPLFRALGHEEASSQVYLWMTLREAQTEAVSSHVKQLN